MPLTKCNDAVYINGFKSSVLLFFLASLSNMHNEKGTSNQVGNHTKKNIFSPSWQTLNFQYFEN